MPCCKVWHSEISFPVNVRFTARARWLPVCRFGFIIMSNDDHDTSNPSLAHRFSEPGMIVFVSSNDPPFISSCNPAHCTELV